MYNLLKPFSIKRLKANSGSPSEARYRKVHKGTCGSLKAQTSSSIAVSAFSKSVFPGGAMIIIIYINKVLLFI